LHSQFFENKGKKERKKEERVLFIERKEKKRKEKKRKKKKEKKRKKKKRKEKKKRNK